MFPEIQLFIRLDPAEQVASDVSFILLIFWANNLGGFNLLLFVFVLVLSLAV